MNSRKRADALTLEILEAIDERSDVTQRRLANQAGVALGLANSYLKRCARKGLVKIQQAPANRYLYYLTPQGFAEKSRLTAQYLSYSFAFYQRASDSCAQAFARCRKSGWYRITLCGATELAEIASLRALEHAMEITSVYDPSCTRQRFLSFDVVTSIAACKAADAWMVTDLSNPQSTYEHLVASLPAERILVPAILGVKRAA